MHFENSKNRNHFKIHAHKIQRITIRMEISVPLPACKLEISLISINSRFAGKSPFSQIETRTTVCELAFLRFVNFFHLVEVWSRVALRKPMASRSLTYITRYESSYPRWRAFYLRVKRGMSMFYHDVFPV